MRTRWILALILVLVMCIIGCSSDITASSPTMSIDQMRDQAQNISYDNLARYPDKYKGVPVTYQGQVIQKVSQTQFRVNVTEDEYGFWDDTVYIVLADNIKDERIIEDDIITFMGLAQGEMTYESVLGNLVYIPRIDIYEVTVLEKGNL